MIDFLGTNKNRLTDLKTRSEECTLKDIIQVDGRDEFFSLRETHEDIIKQVYRRSYLYNSELSR